MKKSKFTDEQIAFALKQQAHFRLTLTGDPTSPLAGGCVETLGNFGRHGWVQKFSLLILDLSVGILNKTGKRPG